MGKYCPICGTQYSDNVQLCSHDGATLISVVADSLVGQVLAEQYQILSKLGEGGMGKVYAARDCRKGKACAVKVLHLEMAGYCAEHYAEHRFLREAVLTAVINHPNAVIVYDFKRTESNLCFLVMEYIQGLSLRELLKQQGPFPPARVVNIIRQVAGALDAAHRSNVIHRDLKPENIMVMDGDRVKVVDFGLAKLYGQQIPWLPTITYPGQRLGTPYYMSPEQLAGSRVDVRSDVYSLALVTYEMLTGAKAFDDKTVEDRWYIQDLLNKARLVYYELRQKGKDRDAGQIIRNVEEYQFRYVFSWLPKPMSVAAPNVIVPESVEDVVLQALCPEPSIRPSSVKVYADQLEKAVALTEDGMSLPLTAQPLQTSAPDVSRSIPLDKGVVAILEQSRSLREVGDYESALHLIDKALKASPSSPEILTEKVEILIEQGSLEKISEAIRTVVALVNDYPNHGPAYYCIGRLKEYEEEIHLAIASYKHCLDLNPGPEYACRTHIRLMMIYSKLFYTNLSAGWLLNAIEMEVQAALTKAPRKSLEFLPRLTLATVYLDRQQYTLAREQLERLLQDNAFRSEKEQAAVYFQLALVAFSEEKVYEAAEASKRAAQLDPQNGVYQKLAQECDRKLQNWQDQH